MQQGFYTVYKIILEKFHNPLVTTFDGKNNIWYVWDEYKICPPFRYSPIGITFLIAGKIVGMETFEVLMTRVGLYFLTVLFGLAIHGAIILPLLYFIMTRRNPYTFLRGILEAMATAFGTSSRWEILEIDINKSRFFCHKPISNSTAEYMYNRTFQMKSLIYKILS